MKHTFMAGVFLLVTVGALWPSSSNAATFKEDITFLKNHLNVIVLEDKQGQSRVAVVPQYQGRVMTSTAQGETGLSFGWINRELIASGKTLPHINVFGGEDRFWVGPEGGQFSVFFSKGARFELADWQTPPAIDALPFQVVKQKNDRASFAASFVLSNYSGTALHVKVKREVRLLSASAAWKKMDAAADQRVAVVAFESDNQILNAGKEPWSKETGALSIWILGMFNPAPRATIVVPIRRGAESDLGKKVTSDYFGEVPADRLRVTEDVVFFKADGEHRSKIGISPKRSKGVLGSYDADNRVLTIVQFTQPRGVSDYVNSLWKLQDNPFAGDAANAYNDGPPGPGAKPLGPFFELESSSPAALLRPGKSLSHTHRTIHLTGPEDALDQLATKWLGVSLREIASALKQSGVAYRVRTTE